MIDTARLWMETTGFEFLLTGMVATTCVFCLAAIISRCCSRQSASFRFLLWQGAILLAVSLPFAVGAFPKLPLGWQLPSINTTASNLPSSIDRSALPSVESNFVDRSMVESALSDSREFESNSVFIDDLPPEDQLQETAEVGSAALPQATIDKPAFSLYSFVKQATVAVWSVVAVWLLIRLLIAISQTMRWRSRSKEFTYGEIRDVRHSLDVNVPVTIGVLRPTILLPVSAKTWSPERLQMVLDHEQAHVRRHDVFWSLVSTAARSVFWFQPMFWIAHRKMLLLSEQACDDQVLQAGTSPAAYASELVALVTDMSTSGQAPSLAAVSISQPPIETRIKSVLDDQVNRKELSNVSRVAIWLTAATLLFCLATIRPFSQSAIAKSTELANTNLTKSNQPVLDDDDAESQNDSRKRLPSAVVGQITDDNDEPLAGVTVRLNQIEKDPHHFTSSVNRNRWQGKTDVAGKFRIEIPEEQRTVSKMFSSLPADAEKEGFVRAALRFNWSKVLKTGDIGTHKIMPGRLLTGRLIEPPEVGFRPPGKGVIKFSGQQSPGRPGWFSYDVVCDPDGSFKTYVPRCGKLNYVAAADNFAPVRGELPAPSDLKAPQEIGDVVLRRGSSVFGKLLDEAGKPMAGMIVQLEEHAPERNGFPHHTIVMPVSSSVKTGPDGYFQLPPHSGKCSLYLVSVGSTRSKGLRGDLVSEQKPPVVKPVEMDLNDSGVSVNVNLRPAQTITISGAFKWDDGQPAEGIEIRGMLSVGSSSQPCSVAITNESGEYQLPMPIEIENHVISVWGGRKDGVWHYARPGRNFEAIQKSAQILVLQNSRKDVANIDWKLVNESRRHAVGQPSVRGPATPASVHLRPGPGKPDISIADKELIDISNNFYKETEQIGALYNNFAGNKQEEEKLNKRSQQLQSKVAKELLEFELKHRGDVAAVNALEQIIKMDPRGPLPRNLNQPQQAAYDILREHYIGNPDLWLVLDSLAKTFPRAYPHDLVRKIQNEDPYPRNRVSAHYFQSEYLAEVLFFYRTMERLGWKDARISPAYLQAIRKLDVDETIATINRNLEAIEKQYAGIERQTSGIPASHYSYVRTTNNSLISFTKRRTDSSSVVYHDRRFTDLAKILDFHINHLAVGKKFPESFWNDSLEQSVSERIEKSNILLLVTFTMPNDAWMHMLTRAKQIPNLEIVWLRNNGPWSAPVSTAAGKVNNKQPTISDLLASGTHVIHDDPQETLALRWGQLNTEAVYVIDKQGIVQAIDTRLSNLIDELESGQLLD